MADQRSLRDMIRELRAEIGHSLDVSQGLNTEEALAYLLQRTQRMLWVEYDWPMRRVHRPVTLAVGQHLYSYPSDLPFNKIDRVWTALGSTWIPLTFGITPADYSVFNTEADIRSTPAKKWDHDPDSNQMEVWPIPSSAGSLLLEGDRTLDNDLVNMDDKATLDSTLIVLRAAAELAERQKMSDSGIKMQAAARYATKLLSQQGSDKRGPISLSRQTPSRQWRPGIDYIP